MSIYTPEELEGLTPSERAALEVESEESDSEHEIIESLANDDNADNSANDNADAAQASQADASANSEETAPKADADAESVIDDGFTPIYSTANAESVDKDALLAQKSEALAKLLDGEITAAEYSKIENDVLKQINDLTVAEVKAQVSQEMTEQQVTREWKKEVNSLIASAKKNDGIDYIADKELYGEFDSLVRAFCHEALNRRGMSDENLAASKWALAKAHSVMKAQHGVKPVAQDAKPQEEKPNRHNVRSLSTLPNADRAQVSDDTISRLGALDGMDLERAMASMSPKEVEKLMASV